MNPKVRVILMILLAAVLVFSLTQLILTQLDYRRGEEIYKDALEQFITVQPASPTPEQPDSPTDESVPGQEEQPDDEDDTPAYTAPVIQSAADVIVDFAALKAVNSEIIGWIIIEQTIISYPLLQGTDNEKYLNTTYNGQNSRQGSIFMDCYNSADFSNRHTVIYGHNMKNNSMFGTLNQYARQGYYDSHRYFHILTEGGLARYEVVSAYTADVTSQTYQRSFPGEGDYEAFLSYIMSQSQINSGVELSSTERIVTLSTCTPTSSTQQRFVVHGRLVSGNQSSDPEPEPGATPEAEEISDSTTERTEATEPLTETDPSETTEDVLPVTEDLNPEPQDSSEIIDDTIQSTDDLSDI